MTSSSPEVHMQASFWHRSGSPCRTTYGWYRSSHAGVRRGKKGNRGGVGGCVICKYVHRSLSLLGLSMFVASPTCGSSSTRSASLLPPLWYWPVSIAAWRKPRTKARSRSTLLALDDEADPRAIRTVPCKWGSFPAFLTGLQWAVLTMWFL